MDNPRIIENVPKEEGVVMHGDGREKSYEYGLYCLWRSLPMMLRSMTREDLMDKMGIDDEHLLDLLALKNQGMFAEHYDIAPATLSNWNKKIREQGIDYLADVRSWAKKVTKNVVFSMYNKLLRKFDPVTADIWFQFIDGWEKKQKVEEPYRGVTQFNIIVNGKRNTDQLGADGEAIASLGDSTEQHNQ